MRLKSFEIKNYNSIVNTGVVDLSAHSKISVLAGQNESGKSSVLGALRDFEKRSFDRESSPFAIADSPTQTVSCTYEVEAKDNILQLLTDETIGDHSIKVEDDEPILDESTIKKIKTFTITCTAPKKTGTQRKRAKASISIDDVTFNIFKSAVLNKKITKENDDEINTETDGETKPIVEDEPYLALSEEDNGSVAYIFWGITPSMVFFDDFCDLLPNSILISALTNEDEEEKAKGYRAVKNLEEILDINFVSKDSESDAVRHTKEKMENDNFQEDWGQRVHSENAVIVKYNFEKRAGEGEAGSYINFYVETKEGTPLPPKRRSKGLIWFLSLWLELKAQDIANNNLILLLDEPDQHLHVRAQKDILKLINTLADKGNQIIYATHSPYLIEIEYLHRIKLVINTVESGTVIEDITTSKIDTTNKRDALQPIADAIGIHLSEYSPLGKNNVLLEGISDFYYFLAMKKILRFDEDFRFIPGIGIRKINNLISLCLGYGLNWIAIVDDDPKEGGKDTKKKFDEIRDFVFDGNEDQAKKKVHVLKEIVGVESMFTFDDLKLIDPDISKNKSKPEAVGKGRKVLFSKTFSEKAETGKITETMLSKTAKDNFNKAFKFIKDNLLQA